MKNFRAQCFYGIQTMAYDVEKTSQVDRGDQVITEHIDKHNTKASIALNEGMEKTKPKEKKKASPTTSLWEAAIPDDDYVQLDWQSTGRKNFHHDHEPSDEMDLFIIAVNDGDHGFKLDTCKLQKHHEKYGEGKECDEMLLQLEDDKPALEPGVNYKKKFGSGKEFNAALEQAQQWQKKYASAD